MMTKRDRGSWAGRLLLLAVCIPVLAACAIARPTGSVPAEPFEDIRLPPSFLPFSGDWALIELRGVTAARLVYQTGLPVERAAVELETALTDRGWLLKAIEPISRAGFDGQSILFAKGPDTCRAEVVASSTTTRVDLSVGRIEKRP
jgi:hypothetical protein